MPIQEPCLFDARAEEPRHIMVLFLSLARVGRLPGSDNGQSVNFVGLGVAGLLTTHPRASAVRAHAGLRARGVGQKTPSSTLIRVRLCDTFDGMDPSSCTPTRVSVMMRVAAILTHLQEGP